jgi:predicted peroxiredoxin
MTLGRFVYLVWHWPIGAVKRSIREGGPVEQWITEKGRKDMEKAAVSLGLSLSGIESKKSQLKPLELHMVVGKRFWYMAAFAVASLLKVLDRELVVYFYSDGSLMKEQAEALKRLPIKARIYSAEEIQDRVEKGLPRERFPNLRERFENYPNIQKLISPHVRRQGAKIVLDADVLFYRRPDELMEWQENPNGVLCAADIEENYGYPREFLERLTDGKLAREVNVGITGLVSEKIDWDLLEKWCTELHAKQGLSYYLEQALIAMLSVKFGCTQLKKDKYITYPKAVQIQERVGTMHHYVDLSKKEYFRELWRDFI